MFTLSETNKGLILIFFGTTLLCYTLGIFEKALPTIVVGGAIVMIVLGFIKIDGLARVRALLSRNK